MKRMLWFLALAVVLSPLAARAQYTPAAAQNVPKERVEQDVRNNKTGQVEHQVIVRDAPKDGYGNANGGQFDLAVDGAFDGETVAVLQLYVDNVIDFAKPRDALKQKGFGVYRWVSNPPSPEELEKALKKSSQLWLISDMTRKLNDKHIAVIKRFFEAGHGVYIWGDNEPYYADANAVAKELLGVTMQGNLPGDKVVNLQKTSDGPGVLRHHLLTTGLEFLYEGITIATLDKSQNLTPLLYGSAGNLVAAFYDHDGKRAILDGGFTRLGYSWDTAGTGRYVKNAAAWLANAERFGTVKDSGAHGAQK